MQNRHLLFTAAVAVAALALPADAAGPPNPSKMPPPTAATMNISPSTAKKLSRAKTMTKIRKAAAAKRFGVIVSTGDLKKPIRLTPRNPWANKWNYLETGGTVKLISGAGRTGLYLIGSGIDGSVVESPSGAKAVNNYLAVNFRAQRGLAYVVSCTAAGTRKDYRAIVEIDRTFDSDHLLTEESGWISVTIPPHRNVRDVRIAFLTDFRARRLFELGIIPQLWWTNSRCDITPADPS